ncbi:MAG TPA: transcriptional regulator, partial [Cytophagales bacterium]|nr:transcriptional regulator [Cytophagales bacterium]
ALGTDPLARFEKELAAQGLRLEDYLLMPLHPWQWENKIATGFAAELHRGHLVYLGEGPDQYSAQQSIRSLFNVDQPEHYYTKTALGILNMGFMRGLSAYYMASTPPISEWITDLLGKDRYLQAREFDMLGEVATVGYRHPDFAALGRSHINNKMLAALWR